MNRLSNLILYIVTIILLIISLIKSSEKTKKALKKAWKSFENILPQFLGIIIMVGIILAIVDTEFISMVIGRESGFRGVLLGSTIGAITLIPGFLAFPTAAMLLKSGAGLMQIGAFVSSLMMVGVVTIPVEIKYFGKKLTIMRNIMAYIFSFIVALIIGKVVAGL